MAMGFCAWMSWPQASLETKSAAMRSIIAPHCFGLAPHEASRTWLTANDPYYQRQFHGEYTVLVREIKPEESYRSIEKGTHA
jgi:hypothetical protein